MPSKGQANKALARRFFEDVVNRGDLALAEELLAADYVDHGTPPGLPKGVEGFRQFVQMLGGAFPDLHVTIEDMLAEGDKVAVRLTVRGTHRGMLLGRIAATGRQATWHGMDIFRIAHGKIAERWSQRDLLGLMQQLGVVTMP